MYRVPAWARRRLKAKGVVVRRFDPAGKAPARGAQVYWGNFFHADNLPRLPELRWIHCASVGVNRAAVPSVFERGIRVTNSRGNLVGPVAAAVVGFVCGLARGYHHAGRLRAAGRLDRDAYEAHFDEMRDLEGDRLLVVGLGDVGTRVAAACAALGMTVEGIRSRPGAKPAFVERVSGLGALKAAAARADFVVDLLPLTEKTRRVFDRAVFAVMKPTAYFINAGRGPTVDEEALAAALRTRRIAGAALDVFDVEPLPRRSPLWRLDNVFLTPHVACLSPGYWERQVSLLERNAARFRAGRPLENAVTLSRGY